MQFEACLQQSSRDRGGIRSSSAMGILVYSFFPLLSMVTIITVIARITEITLVTLITLYSVIIFRTVCTIAKLPLVLYFVTVILSAAAGDRKFVLVRGQNVLDH